MVDLSRLRIGETQAVHAQAKDIEGRLPVRVALDFQGLATGTNTPSSSVFTVTTDASDEARATADGTVTAVGSGTADLKVSGLAFTGTDDEDTRFPVTVLDANRIVFTPSALEYYAVNGDEIATAFAATTTGQTYPSGISIAGVDARFGEGSEPTYTLSNVAWTFEGPGAGASFDTDNDGNPDGITASGVTSTSLLISVGDSLFDARGKIVIRVTAQNSVGQTIGGTMGVLVRMPATVELT